MALTANKIPRGSVLTHQTTLLRYHEKQRLSSSMINEIQLSRNGMGHGLLAEGTTLFNEGFRCLYGKPFRFISKKPLFLCKSLRANNIEEKGFGTTCHDVAVADITGSLTKAKKGNHNLSGQRLAGASRFAHEDAKFLNERARSDIPLLSCGMMTLEACVRQDATFLGTEFLKLDVRAREDTQKIDREVKEKAKLLHHLATILKDKAQSRLKSAADEHWSDGALKVDLHLADFLAKQRVMEDTLMALEFAKNIHEMMVNRMYEFKSSLPANNVGGCITHQKNKETIDFFTMDVSTDRTAAIQEAYWSIQSALSEDDGIDYTDPEELELVITALIDLDAMDGKQSVSLLAECASSPDVNTRTMIRPIGRTPQILCCGIFNDISFYWPVLPRYCCNMITAYQLGHTLMCSSYLLILSPSLCGALMDACVSRQALANALAKAPSTWALGNAGMGALQRLAEDSSPAISAAASRAIYELNKQWVIEGYTKGNPRQQRI